MVSLLKNVGGSHVKVSLSKNVLYLLVKEKTNRDKSPK